MTSRDFCYWLQGYFELTKERKATGIEMNAEQVGAIQRHLALVFKHEIDPSAGPPEHQSALDHIHEAGGVPTTPGLPSAPLFRC